MKKYRAVNARDDIDAHNRIFDVAQEVSSQAVQAMCHHARVHPSSAIVTMTNVLVLWLRHMDKDAANEILKDIMSETPRPDVQQDAMSALVDGYEAQVEAAEHAGNGGIFQ